MLTEKSDSTSDKSRSAFEQSKMANSEYMRRPIRAKTITVLAIAVLALAGTAAAQYTGGTGEPNDPYRIATPQNLNDIGNYEEDWDKHFILINDVNLAQYSGTQFNIIGRWIDYYDPSNRPFVGVFDGNEHKILNLTYNSTGRNGVGLFGYLGERSEIKTLGMENVDVNVVNGWHVGGLVGHNYFGTITDCYSTGSVSGYVRVGGLVGGNKYGTITNCCSTGSVSGDMYIGGLMGYNFSSPITNSYSTGSITGIAYVGGLVGENDYYGMITKCYSTGSVSGRVAVGGLVGLNKSTVTASFWDTQTSGQSASSGGTGKRTAEMKTISTFTTAGWDFVEIWGIGENQTYPFLRTEPAGDLSHDKKVDFVDLAIMAMHWLATNNP